MSTGKNPVQIVVLERYRQSFFLLGLNFSRRYKMYLKDQKLLIEVTHFTYQSFYSTDDMC